MHAESPTTKQYAAPTSHQNMLQPVLTASSVGKNSKESVQDLVKTTEAVGKLLWENPAV